MNLVGIAVALFLAGGIGSDSVGLLCDGIHKLLGIRFGNASVLYDLVMIVAAFIFAHNHLGMGTIVYALLSGYFIDLYGILLEPFQLYQQTWFVRSGTFIVGQRCLSLGLALLIQLELGMNALDALIYKIHNKTNIPYAIIRTGSDISYVVIGTLCGGVFGIGTVCLVLLTGTMVNRIVVMLEQKRNGKVNA